MKNIKLNHKSTLKSDGSYSCRNCSEYGEPKQIGTIMIVENDSIFCLHCYRIMESIVN